MAVYVPQFDITDLDWSNGTLRVVSESLVTVLLYIEKDSQIIYVLDVKGVEL